MSRPPADLPGPSPGRRLSIRSAMALILVFGVVLAREVNRARAQRRAVEAIKVFGGHVWYDDGPIRSVPVRSGRTRLSCWLRDQLGDDYFSRVIGANLTQRVEPDGTRTNARQSAEAVPCLRDLPDLENLDLQGAQASESNLAYIGGLRRLKVLRLDSREVTDAGIAGLNALTELRTVTIDRARITDESLRSLATRPNLESLCIYGNAISDRGLSYLSECHDLRNLQVGYSRGKITDAGIAHLVGLEKLEVLDIQYTDVTDGSLVSLKRLPRLSYLYCAGTRLTGVGLRKLHEGFPKLWIGR